MYPGNPFSPEIRKGCLIWSSLIPTRSSQVQEVVEIQDLIGRSTLINTGGHGSIDGLNPTKAQMGHG